MTYTAYIYIYVELHIIITRSASSSLLSVNIMHHNWSLTHHCHQPAKSRLKTSRFCSDLKPGAGAARMVSWSPRIFRMKIPQKIPQIVWCPSFLWCWTMVFTCFYAVLKQFR